MLIILQTELVTESNQFFETVFPTIAAFLGVIAGGVLTFFTTRYQTRKDTEKEDKKERKEIAAKVSTSLSHLQLVAASNLLIPFVEDTTTANKKTSDAFTETVLLRHELAYCLPNYAQEAMQNFLDATETNIRCWRNRLKNKEDPAYTLTKEDSTRIPHLDQAQGEAYTAPLNAYSSLKDYVNDKSA